MGEATYQLVQDFFHQQYKYDSAGGGRFAEKQH